MRSGEHTVFSGHIWDLLDDDHLSIEVTNSDKLEVEGKARTSLMTWRKEYGLSVDFFSSFLSCSRRSAAVRNERELSLTWVDILALAFGLDFLAAGSSSSSSSSSSVTMDCREEGREEEDFTDAGSISESEGTMKSSSSEALEDFRPFFTGDFLNLVSL